MKCPEKRVKRQYRMRTFLLERESANKVFLGAVRVDFEVVLCRIGSVEQLLQLVKIPAEEPVLRGRRVFPILEDIEDGSIHDSQIQASDSLREFLGSTGKGAALPCIRKHTALGHRSPGGAQSSCIF